MKRGGSPSRESSKKKKKEEVSEFRGSIKERLRITQEINEFIIILKISKATDDLERSALLRLLFIFKKLPRWNLKVFFESILQSQNGRTRKENIPVRKSKGFIIQQNSWAWKHGRTSEILLSFIICLENIGIWTWGPFCDHFRSIQRGASESIIFSQTRNANIKGKYVYDYLVNFCTEKSFDCSFGRSFRRPKNRVISWSKNYAWKKMNCWELTVPIKLEYVVAVV